MDDQPVLFVSALLWEQWGDALRAQGLMYRTSMPAGSGMVFVYDDEAPRSFWMKDTRIPLSIAFVSSSGRIVSISDMQPLNTTSVPSGAPARYAIEVNKGWFAEHDVAVGDMVMRVAELAMELVTELVLLWVVELVAEWVDEGVAVREEVEDGESPPEPEEEALEEPVGLDDRVSVGFAV
jgi:uncharacterized membrane protein (UPF0127 family)